MSKKNDSNPEIEVVITDSDGNTKKTKIDSNTILPVEQILPNKLNKRLFIKSIVSLSPFIIQNISLLLFVMMLLKDCIGISNCFILILYIIVPRK